MVYSTQTFPLDDCESDSKCNATPSWEAQVREVIDTTEATYARRFTVGNFKSELPLISRTLDRISILREKPHASLDACTAICQYMLAPRSLHASELLQKCVKVIIVCN